MGTFRSKETEQFRSDENSGAKPFCSVLLCNVFFFEVSNLWCSHSVWNRFVSERCGTVTSEHGLILQLSDASASSLRLQRNFINYLNVEPSRIFDTSRLELGLFNAKQFLKIKHPCLNIPMQLELELDLNILNSNDSKEMKLSLGLI